MTNRGVSIVVPTYREAANIPTLAERIDRALTGEGVTWELVLSDDDSGDGSETIARRLAERLPVRFVSRHGKRPDLSAAVLDGIAAARFDRLVVMDADLSHPPEEIAELLATLEGDCDMAVGSRYVAGARIDKDWSRWRVWNSRLAIWLTRPLTPCADRMSGFFAIDRASLPAWSGLDPIGYKIGLELIVRGGLRVREVPTRFDDRRHGSSKLTLRQQFVFLRHLHRLYLFRFGMPLRLLSFGAVGATGLILDTALYFGLQWAGVGHLLARFASFWPAVTWNWRINRALTFADRPKAPRIGQWSRFAASSFIGLTTNVGSYAVLTTFVEAFSDRLELAFLIGVGIGFGANFATATRFVYGRRRQVLSTTAVHRPAPNEDAS